MNTIKKLFVKNKGQASGSIEFLAVFVCLFIFFILIIDVALFFRQIYLIQTIADETIANLSVSRQCGESESDTISIVRQTLKNYFGTRDFSYSAANDKTIEMAADDGDFKFILTCRNSTTPDALIFTYKYKGIFMYRSGKNITSNVSSNTSYF